MANDADSDVSPASRAAIAELREALDFFDRVLAATSLERVAVGSDHWDWVITAARKVTETADQ